MCCNSNTNLNILSPAGRKPSLSANVTIPSPTGGTNTNRPNIIAAVVLKPSLELPGPEKHLQAQNEVLYEMKENQICFTVDEIPTKCQQYTRDHGVPESQMFQRLINSLFLVEDK